MAGRNFESEEKMVKYQHSAVDSGIIFICSELSIHSCGDLVL